MDHAAFVHRTPAEAEKGFLGLLGLLEKHIASIPGHTEKKNAVRHWATLKKAAPYLFREEDKEKRSRYVDIINVNLADLEKLFAGQMTMFASLASRVVSRFLGALSINPEVQKIFTYLREIIDNLDKTYAGDTMRNLGLKPARPPADRPRAPKPAKTYQQAQADIMKALKANGWELSGNLAVPHATSPDGKVRFWFKAQAIYFSYGPDMKRFGEARSVPIGDYRNESTDSMVKYLERFAQNMAKKVE